LLLITIVGIVIVAFGAYLTIAYLTQSGEAKFAGVQMNLPFGVIVMIVGVVVIVFPYTPLYEGTDTDNSRTTAVSPNTSSVSTSPTSTNPPTTISKEQEESRKKRLLSVIPDQGIRSTCSKTRDDHFAGSLMVMECPSSGLVALRLGLFPNATALYRVYNRDAEEAGVERNSGSANFCESEPAEGPWSISGEEPYDGRLFCHVNNEGRVWFEWTYDKARVLAYAYRGDDNFKALNRWWMNF
jgi:hypothetical protein